MSLGLSFEGHEFSVGMHSLKGRTSPWNTFAIWDVKYLSRTGFLLISDGVEQNDKSGGVEVMFYLLSWSYIKAESCLSSNPILSY